MLGQNPNMRHLRVFGMVVYPYSRPYNVHKLQSRSVQCVFMGYASGYKGVLCYKQVTSKFLFSRHAVHDESIFPFTKKILSSLVNTIKSSSIAPVIIYLILSLYRKYLVLLSLLLQDFYLRIVFLLILSLALMYLMQGVLRRFMFWMIMKYMFFCLLLFLILPLCLHLNQLILLAWPLELRMV